MSLDIIKALPGNKFGNKLVSVYGRTNDIDSADGFESLWYPGGVYTGFNATAAQTILVSSDSANDTSAGSGARTLRIYGLDENYAEQEETVTLNGVTAVETANTYIRVNTVLVKTAGATGSNVGTITGKQSTTVKNVFFSIAPTYNFGAHCSYTVPAGYTAYVLGFGAHVLNSATPLCEVHLVKQDETDGVMHVHEVLAASSYLNYRYFPIIDDDPSEEKTDIELRLSTSTDNTKASGYIDLLLIKT